MIIDNVNGVEDAEIWTGGWYWRQKRARAWGAGAGVAVAKIGQGCGLPS